MTQLHADVIGNATPAPQHELDDLLVHRGRKPLAAQRVTNSRSRSLMTHYCRGMEAFTVAWYDSQGAVNAMQIPVLLEPVANNGFRAVCGEPLRLQTEAPTREEAVARLRELIERRVAAGAEVIAVSVRPAASATPVDEIRSVAKLTLEVFGEDPAFRYSEDPDTGDCCVVVEIVARGTDEDLLRLSDEWHQRLVAVAPIGTYALSLKFQAHESGRLS